VYPAREEQGRWRAVWHENGQQQQCEAATEDKLAAKLAKVRRGRRVPVRGAAEEPRVPPDDLPSPHAACLHPGDGRHCDRLRCAACGAATPQRDHRMN
jgi:hypothetical protein